jgi:sugar O-acyltransferase (sialic acid O-acetyltransferase NeuD family)
MESRFSSTYVLSDSNGGIRLGSHVDSRDGGTQLFSATGMPNVVVVGCSGHARVVIDILETDKRCRIVGLLDSYKPVETRILGYQILGTEADLPALIDGNICDSLVVAVGDNWIRGQIVNQLRRLVPNLRLITAIHPSAQIARDVLIGAGTVVMPGVVVNAGCRIGEGCILNTCSSLDHDSTMEEFSSLAPRAVTGGNVWIGAYSAVAIGAVVSHATRIGEHTVVGAGALVVKDIPRGVVAYGIPARIIRKRSPDDAYLGERVYERPKVDSAVQYGRVAEAHVVVKLIAADNPEWDRYVKKTAHDFFHTSAYHRITEAFGGGEAWLAVCGDEKKFIAWPMIMQDLKGLDLVNADTWKDVTSVYGYTGPVACGCDDDHTFLRTAWDAIRELWRSHGVVSAFTRFHPLVGNYRYLPCLRDDRKQIDFVHDSYAEGATVAIDLALSPEAIWQSYSRHLHQALRRLIRQGITVTPDPEWAHLNDFIRMYHSTMKRNNAGEFYFFSPAYFGQLRDALGPHGSLMIAKCGDEIAAAGLLIEYGGIVNVHLLATDDTFLPLSPSKLLIHEAQAWARARGNRFVHLGGGRGSRTDDPLFRFKSQFSDRSYPFYTGRWVVNPGVYDALAAQRSQQTVSAPVRETGQAFFPAYRTPI